MTIVPTPLESAIQAIKSGDKATSRRLLAETLRADPAQQIWL